MGGSPSTEETAVVAGAQPLYLPSGTVDPRLVGRYRNATINVVKPTRNELERERNNDYGSREVVMELNANGTFLLILYEFDSPHLVYTTKMKGTWGRFSGWVVLNCTLYFYGFSCGNKADAWVQAARAYHLRLSSPDIFYESDRLYKVKDNQSQEFMQTWETHDNARKVYLRIAKTGTFFFKENRKQDAIVHFGEWFLRGAHGMVLQVAKTVIVSFDEIRMFKIDPTSETDLAEIVRRRSLRANPKGIQVSVLMDSHSSESESDHAQTLQDDTINLALALWKFDQFIVLSSDLLYKTQLIAESTQLDHLNKNDLVLSVVGSSKRRDREGKVDKEKNTHWLYTTDWEKMERDILRKRGLLTKEEEARMEREKKSLSRSKSSKSEKKPTKKTSSRKHSHKHSSKTVTEQQVANESTEASRFFDSIISDDDELSFPSLPSPPNNSMRLTNSASPRTNSNRRTREDDVLTEDMQQKLQLLIDMGFPDRAENLEALRVSNRDVASAIDYMMAKNLEDII